VDVFETDEARWRAVEHEMAASPGRRVQVRSGKKGWRQIPGLVEQRKKKEMSSGLDEFLFVRETIGIQRYLRVSRQIMTLPGLLVCSFPFCRRVGCTRNRGRCSEEGARTIATTVESARRREPKAFVCAVQAARVVYLRHAPRSIFKTEQFGSTLWAFLLGHEFKLRLVGAWQGCIFQTD
jgi:hypothetical protein